MPTETYTVRYVADASSFVAGARQVEALVRSVDAAVTTAKKNMSGMFGSAGRSAASAATKVDQFGQALGKIPRVAVSAGQALRTVQGASGNAVQEFALLEASIGKIAGAAASLSVVTIALKELTKAFDEARKHLNEGADKGLGMKDKAREYATLAGKNSPGDEEMKRLFAIQMAGGGTFDEAMEYGNAFMGSWTAGRDKGFITEEQAKLVEPEGKAFGDRIGLDPETAGKLAGIIPQYVDLTKDERGNKLTTEQGVEKLAGQQNAIAYGLNEGQGKVSTLANSEFAAATSIASNHVADPAELAAFAGVASTFSKSASGSGTTFKQMDRLVNENLDEGGDFLRSTGVADEKGDYAKLAKLKTHVDAQRRASADPSKFDSKAYLQSKGFHNDTELDATIGFMENLPVLKKRIEGARARSKDGAATLKANEQFRSSDVGQYRQNKASNEVGNYLQTERRQKLQSAREGAYGQLQTEEAIDTPMTNTMDFLADWTVGWIGFQTKESKNSKQARIDARVFDNFRAAATKAGLDDTIEAKYPNYKQGYTGRGGLKLEQALNEFGPEIEAKGISLNGDNASVQAQVQGGQVPAGQVPAQANGMQVGAGAGPGAGAAAAGANGTQGAAAAGAGGKVASIDASGLDKASDKLAAVTDKLDRVLSKSMGTPGSGLGGGYGPYRA